MPNIASVLKSEFSRVARRELRGEILSLRKSASGYRTDIAALKRRTQALEQQLRRLSRDVATAKSAPESEESSGPRRFSAKGFASLRRRLGVSARELGLLIGASPQSIYNWEEGKTRPQSKHLSAVAELRGMGKRAVAARLSSVAGAG